MTATYEKIATTTLGSASATITFTSISGSYTDLIIIMNGYSSNSDGFIPRLQFNSDTGSNYSRTILKGNGATAGSNRQSNQTVITLGQDVGWDTTSTEPAYTFVNIMNYSNTTTYKSVLFRDGAASGTYPGTEAGVGLWRSTSAITSITITFGDPSYQAATGSTFTLYGIKAE